MLHQLDAQFAESGAKMLSRIIDFDAISDPEGSLLLIDARTVSYVHRYTDVQAYLASPYCETREVRVATITGVGSSALGAMGPQAEGSMDAQAQQAMMEGMGSGQGLQAMGTEGNQKMMGAMAGKAGQSLLGQFGGATTQD